MKTSIAFKPANRQQDSIVAPLEKRILARLAARMPGWVNPDHLTLLGFAGMALAGLSYYLARWNRWMLLASVAFLAVNWFGDSLDGTLARYRNRQRPRYGFYVDHMVDALGILFLIGGLGLSGYMSPVVAMALMIAYYLLSIEIYLATYTIGVFKLSFGIWGPTELLILLASRAGTLVTRADIQETLWADGQFVEFEHAINVAVKKIREALDDDPLKPRFIETVPKKGYRFIGAIDVEPNSPPQPRRGR